MLHHVRRHLRSFAATMLVLVSVVGAWSTAAHGLDCHDRDGAPVFVAHDASAHAFRSPVLPDRERTVHCVLCHWTRTFGPGVQSVSTALDVVSRTLAVPARDAVVSRFVAAAQPPLRAPPAVSTLLVVA
jgi:hypothetical protein